MALPIINFHVCIKYSFYLGFKYSLCPLYLFSFLMRKATSIEIISIIGLFLIVLFYITQNVIYFYLIAILLIASLIYPRFLEFLSSLWYYIAKFLNVVSSNIFLSLFYFIFLTPYSILYRSQKGKSRLIEKERGEITYDKKDFENLW